MMAHTPGPWHGDDERQRDATFAICQSGYRVATVHMRDNTRPPFSRDAEQEANARLIAAAPDLLAALKEMAAMMEMLWEAVPWGKTFNLDAQLLNEAPLHAKAAIAKAEQS